MLAGFNSLLLCLWQDSAASSIAQHLGNVISSFVLGGAEVFSQENQVTCFI
jgi:hypothetical protein